PRNSSASEQGLYLRPKAKCPAVVRGVEWLDAVKITREKDCALRFIPDHEGEHPAKLLHHLGAVTRIQMQQHLGVGRRSETNSASFEFFPQSGVVIDLPIKYNDEAAVFAGHRLRCALR